LYEVLHLYVNFFLPVVKLKEKVRHGNKVTKKYDVPQTPYQRVLASSEVSTKVKAKLRAQYATLNVVQLHTQIEQLVKRLWATGRRVA
jgi:ribose 1,5-bisphosphokinase PhnN